MGWPGEKIRSSQWTPVLALFVLETWHLTWSLGGTEMLRTDILSLCLILVHPGFCGEHSKPFGSLPGLYVPLLGNENLSFQAGWAYAIGALKWRVEILSAQDRTQGSFLSAFGNQRGWTWFKVDSYLSGQVCAVCLDLGLCVMVKILYFHHVFKVSHT